MTAGQPPTTVPDLLAKVKVSLSNIQKHRDAMAKVAADAAAKRSQPVQGEVNTQ